MEACTCRSH